MPDIDFQPFQQTQAPQAASNIDFQPFNTSQNPSSPVQPQGMQDTTGTLGKVDAGAMGFVRGSLDSANAMGQLAANVLNKADNVIADHIPGGQTLKDLHSSMIQPLQKVGQQAIDSLKDYFSPKTDFEKRAMKENSSIASIAKNVGYIGGMISGGNILTKPVGVLTGPLAKAAPLISKSPILSGTLDSGAQNAVIGAAQDPDHPIKGAIVGGFTGASLHGVTGSAGYKMNRTAQIINDEIKARQATGAPVYTPEAVEDIQAALKTNGIVKRQQDVKQAIGAQVQRQIDPIAPEGYTPDQDPINTVAKMAADNLPKEVENSKALYQPINENTTQLPHDNLDNAVAQIPESVKNKISLPKPLPENATLDQMLQQRRQLDASTIKQAQRLEANGTISHDEITPIYNAREALNDDIHAGADKVGLGSALSKAEDHYNNVLRPYNVIDKLGNVKQMSSSQIQNKVWQKASRQLNGRYPDPEKIKAIAQTLGPNGANIMGWAKIQNDVKMSTVNGIFNPTTFGSRISRSEQSGLNSMIMSPEHRQVVQGLQNISKYAAQVIPKNPSSDGLVQSMLSSVANHTTRSRPLMSLVKQLGSPSLPAVRGRAMVQQLLEGYGALTAVNKSKGQ